VRQKKKSHEGTGLGLPLAAGLMAAHGRSLSIDSRPHEGSTVRLILPVSQIVKQAAE